MNIRPFVTPLAVLLVTLIGMAWLSVHILGGLALGLSVWAIAVLQQTNLPRAQRHTQWPWPLTALVWSLAALGMMFWLNGHYQPFLAAHGRSFSWLYQTFSIQLPSDFAQAVPLLGAVFLSLFAFAKGLLMPVARAAIASQSFFGNQAGLAYHLLSGQDWKLIPRWLYVRRLAKWAAFTGLVCMIASGLFAVHMLDGESLPLLAAAMLLVGMEVSAWLGGEVADEWKPHLEGEDTTPDLHGQFLAIWKAYRDTWPGKWLVAGNLPPRRPGGPSEDQ
jgi:hypothetical protein